MLLKGRSRKLAATQLYVSPALVISNYADVDMCGPIRLYNHYSLIGDNDSVSPGQARSSSPASAGSAVVDVTDQQHSIYNLDTISQQ